MTSIGVVMVNHHSEDLIVPVVHRLDAAGLGVVVVDNSGTYEGPGTVVDAGANLGFGAACNLGEAALRADVDLVCLHNPDLHAEPSVILELADRLRSSGHRPGALAPAVRDSAILRTAGYRYPSVAREALLAAGLRRKGTTVGSTEGRRFASAALLVVDREAWQQVAGFDERFFLYCEDLDFWHRLDTAGRSCGFAPDLVVQHDQASGSLLRNERRELLRWLGIELFAATSSLLDWRALRRIHRVAIFRLRGAAPTFVDAVQDLWKTGADPVTVADALRPGFVDGSLLGASAPAEVPA